MKKILLASNNLHKVKEIEAFFEGKIKFIIPSDIGILNLPEENGKNFAENSKHKVKNISEKIDLPILGDDSGLIVKPICIYIKKLKDQSISVDEISRLFSSFVDKKYKEKTFNFWKDFLPALDKFPGVVSKRFGYIDDEHIRNNYLVSLLKSISEKSLKWSAYFETSLSLRYNNKIFTFKGKTEGYIIEKPSGNNGFGYDPIFFYPPFNKTFAQLSLEEKNRVSHRSKALEKLKLFLENSLELG